MGETLVLNSSSPNTTNGLTPLGSSNLPGYTTTDGLASYVGTPSLYQNGTLIPNGSGDVLDSSTVYQQQLAQQQAAAQEAARVQALRDGFNSQKTGILNSANTAAQQRGLEYKQSIDRWGLGAKQAQQGLDNRGINAEMAKSQGMKGILGMVGRGVRSAGVMLANKNAGDSSAAGALANAYGDVGRRQASGVNNAYGLEQNQIGLDQQNLDAGNALSLKEFEDNKTTVVNTIVSEAENALAALDAQIAGASLPDRIAIEQEKQAIRNNAMAQLTQYDGELATQKAAAAATDIDARRTEASRLSSMGQASNMDFGYTTDVPAQFQGTGPYPSELPIFTYGRNRKSA